jgi:hypothetical protein
MNRRNDPLPDDVRPPDPPPELRRRALVSAHAAMATGQVADRWHRLWTSRPLRLAWAATVVGLIGSHLLIEADAPAAPAEPALPIAAVSGNVGELAEIVELGRLTAELPGWEIAVPTNRESTRERNTS